MTDARTLTADRRDYRLSPLLFRRIWRLAKPYWTDPAHWKVWLLAAALLAFLPGSSAIGYLASRLAAEVTNAIVAHHRALYVRLFWLATVAGFAMFFVRSFTDYLSNRVQLAWTRWMTDWMVERYLAHRTYYDIALREDLDNPDQRIESELPIVIANLSNLPKDVLMRVMQVATGGFIVASVDPKMTIFVVLYTVISTAVTFVLFAASTRLNFQVAVTGADLRYGILHVRDHAETVAFYKGEAHEETQINHRIDRSVRAQKHLMSYTSLIFMLNNLMKTSWDVAPFFFVAPLFFAGKIQFGAIAMATSGAYQLRSALEQLTTFLPTVAAAAPSAVRLAQILERFDKMDAERAREGEHLISLQPGPAIRLDRVSLETPGGEQRLFEDVDFHLAPGSALVIIGQTGVGKSSLLRAVAGLWRRGRGRITAPPVEDCLFLPQKPYMILGDLRSQLLYPRGRATMTDAELQRILERVRLPNLVAQNGGLDAVRDWGKVLSLGEQQRVAFARILISGAQTVFLDEATSAVDITTEAALYALLREERLTYVSVGHRETILAFHDRTLELFPGGHWRILPTAQLRQSEVQSMGMARA